MATPLCRQFHPEALVPENVAVTTEAAPPPLVDATATAIVATPQNAPVATATNPTVAEATQESGPVRKRQPRIPRETCTAIMRSGKRCPIVPRLGSGPRCSRHQSQSPDVSVDKQKVCEQCNVVVHEEKWAQHLGSAKHRNSTEALAKMMLELKSATPDKQLKRKATVAFADASRGGVPDIDDEFPPPLDDGAADETSKLQVQDLERRAKRVRVEDTRDPSGVTRELITPEDRAVIETFKARLKQEEQERQRREQQELDRQKRAEAERHALDQWLSNPTNRLLQRYF